MPRPNRVAVKMRKRSGRENNLLRWSGGKVVSRRHLGLPALPSKRPSVYRSCNLVFHYSPYAEIDQYRLILSLWLTLRSLPRLSPWKRAEDSDPRGRYIDTPLYREYAIVERNN